MEERNEMRVTYPVFKSSISKTRQPIVHIVELLYHTVIPCAITYMAIKNDEPLMLIILLLPMLVRFRPEEIKNNS